MKNLKDIISKEKSSNSSQKKLSDIIKLVRNGELLLPDFQRGYVWDLEKTRQLLLSIINDSVVGGILIWKTKQKINVDRTIGDCIVQYNTDNYYILDGQQRMTSLCYALKGLTYKNHDFSTLKINLKATCLNELIVITRDEGDYLLPFSKIENLRADDLDHIDQSLKEERDVVNFIYDLRFHVLNYLITVFEFETDDLEDAIYQFNALNSGGKNMTKEEILLSKIYSNQFKLKEKLEQIVSELKDFGVKEALILSCLSLALKGSYGSKEMLSIEYDEVLNHWKRFVDSLKITCDYLKSIRFSTIDSLPYKNCFMAINKVIFDEKLTSLDNEKSSMFKKYIVISALTSRYNRASTVNTLYDIKKMKNSKNVDFGKVDVNIEEIIKNGSSFSTTNANPYRKMMMWVISQKSPISLLNNNPINIEGKSYSKKYCKNLHHIFPKNFMKEKKTNYEVDHAVNICMIEADVNQRIISDKAPSIYLEILNASNKNIKLACDTHLIDYDVAIKDDYDDFFVSRIYKIKEAIEFYIS